MIARIATGIFLAAALVGVTLVGGGANPSQAAEILGPSGVAVRLETRQGRLIRLQRPAGTVFIADADIADVQVKTPQLLYIFGKRAGTTTLYVVDTNDRVLLNRTVSVTHNLSQLQSAIRSLLPGEDIGVRSVNGSIVLSGHASTSAAAEDARDLASRFVRKSAQIINQLEVTAPQQVNLRVRVTEIARSTLKDIGVNLDVLAKTGNFVVALATGNPTVLGGLPAFAPINGLGPPANQILNTRDESRDSLFTNFNNGTVDASGLLEALETEGLIKVLAEPNLSALSGETASFLAGGEFPVPVPQDQDTITVKFKKFGVSLGFTPTIVDNNRINLKVAPEVSQLSNAGAVILEGFSIPALTVRRAETTIELGSGQSFAIAGLLQNDSNFDIDKTPWLGDIPILGNLFRSEQFQRRETELLIVVTPYVVKPLDAKQIVARSNPAPTTGDLNRVLTGDREPGIDATGADSSAAVPTPKARGAEPTGNASPGRATVPDAAGGSAKPTGDEPESDGVKVGAAVSSAGTKRLIGPAGFALE
ncbi:MAG: type II and III secretion system protein family protein [Alphaproteobacteria bacterium]|nr:type II and III secretion system protein family protein [Alphaproteobacteria bacterium]